jgi:DNA polymerase elongation subunit (family B)
MPTLVFDIETIGQDFESFDELTRSKLIHAINEDDLDDLPEAEADLLRIQRAQEPLGLSPFTGKITAIACVDAATNKGGVYFEAPGLTIDEQDKAGFKYQSMDEKQILEKFWELSLRCNEFVTYNGRAFDLPFIMLRSAVHNIRPPKNISKARYLYQMDRDAVHIDLYDQLTFYRAFHGGNMNLHMACQAFGICSPKQGGMDGSQVGTAFKEGRYKEIAEYCLADVIATVDLYHRWNTYLRF